MLMVKFIVEANSFEELELWKEFNKRVIWEEARIGDMETVGYFNKMPVNISRMVDKLNGHDVLFWDAISQVVHHGMIDEYFKVHYHNIPRCNAMNFHQVILGVEKDG